MAIIGIKKLIEINNIGYYVVGVQSDEKMYHFYIGVDKQKKIIHFYKNENCTNPSQSTKYENDYKMTNEVHDIEPKVLLRIGHLVSNIFQQDNFPDSDVWTSRYS